MPQFQPHSRPKPATKSRPWLVNVWLLQHTTAQLLTNARRVSTHRHFKSKGFAMQGLSFSARCKTALHLGGAYRASSAAIAICRTCRAQLAGYAKQASCAYLKGCVALPVYGDSTPAHAMSANSFIPCPLRHCKAFAARYPYSSVSWNVALRRLSRSCILIKLLAKRHGPINQARSLHTGPAQAWR